MSMEFSDAEKSGLTKAIYGRRDIRNFRPTKVSDDTLLKILEAGHNAPSVGFSQPWNFLLISDNQIKKSVYDHFTQENKKVIDQLEGEQSETYASLKLQGLLDAPHHLVVTCNQSRNPENRLGRATVTEADIYSTCLAVQNIWLTARSEGIGIGWMSIYDPIELPKLLGIPVDCKIIAYLCLGYPVEFPKDPVLETSGWAKREKLSELVFEESWGKSAQFFPTRKPLDYKNSNQIEARDFKSAQSISPSSNKEKSCYENGSLEINNIQHSDESITFDSEFFLSRMNSLTKPVGSIGELEKIAYRLASIQNTNFPVIDHKAVLIIAGDHGIAEENISAYPQATTYKMVYQFLSGGGAISSLARSIGAKLYISDLGVKHKFGESASLIGKKIRLGTRNFLKEDALNLNEVNLAIEVGQNLWKEMDSNIDVLSLGEVGIGNTTVSAILACIFYDLDPEIAVGKGTGIDDGRFQNKIEIVKTAIGKYKNRILSCPNPGMEALITIGGLEIAGMVGVILGSKQQNTAIVLDGLISTIAGVIALMLDPSSMDKLFFGHLSMEPAHALVLAKLGVRPILNLDLRLGEASGSTMAIAIMEQSIRLVNEMKTWDEVNWNG